MCHKEGNTLPTGRVWADLPQWNCRPGQWSWCVLPHGSWFMHCKNEKRICCISIMLTGLCFLDCGTASNALLQQNLFPPHGMKQYSLIRATLLESSETDEQTGGAGTTCPLVTKTHRYFPQVNAVPSLCAETQHGLWSLKFSFPAQVSTKWSSKHQFHPLSTSPLKPSWPL